MTIRSEKELGMALKDDADTIEIEGDLVSKVIRIKATGTVAWGVCIAALAVAVTAAVIALPTGGTSAPLTFGLAGGAATILGVPAAISAVAIAVAAGGVGALNKLRGYSLEKISDSKIVLRK